MAPLPRGVQPNTGAQAPAAACFPAPRISLLPDASPLLHLCPLCLQGPFSAFPALSFRAQEAERRPPLRLDGGLLPSRLLSSLFSSGPGHPAHNFILHHFLAVVCLFFCVFVVFVSSLKCFLCLDLVHAHRVFVYRVSESNSSNPFRGFLGHFLPASK